MNTIPGISFQPACRAVRATMPQAIHTTPSSKRKPGCDGRLPTCEGGGGPGGLRRSAIEGMLQRRGGRRHRA